MRAVRLHEIGGPDHLVVEEVPTPQPGGGEVLVRIRAAALNHRDVFIAQGKYVNIQLPAILGSDGAGEIAALGTDVTGFVIGEEVVVNPCLDWGDDPQCWESSATILGMPRSGTFAEYVAVPATNVYRKPPALTMEEAAAIPLAGLTAYRATFTRGSLRAGETILITGIGGGVQTFVLLFAKNAGARTIVTSSNDTKLELAKALGADVVLNYRTDPEWHKAARKAGPIDIAVDSSGGDTLAKLATAVRPGGRIVIYGGTHPEATVRLFPIFWNQLTIAGTSMGSPRDFAAMLGLFEQNSHPAIDRVFPMEDVVNAAKRLDNAEQFGKIILRID